LRVQVAKIARDTAGEIQTRPDSFGSHDEILLGVLAAVERDSYTSQRSISRELDVALGLANAYLKRCVRKGFIKIKQVPRRRYVYYLTPQGFAEKTRLAGQYFTASFNFFRRARQQMSELMAECASRGQTRILLAGVSELAEVGTLCAYDHQVTLVAIVDPKCAGQKFCGLPVKASLAECGEFDVVIVTTLANPGATFEAMRAAYAPDRVLAPALLRVALAKAPDRAASQQAAE
jgi:DNA-binding MarR family transcriptional regulator